MRKSSIIAALGAAMLGATSIAPAIASPMFWVGAGVHREIDAIASQPTARSDRRVWEFQGVARHMAMMARLERIQPSYSHDRGDLANTYVSPASESFAIAERVGEMVVAGFDAGDMSNTYVAPSSEAFAIAARVGELSVAGFDAGDLSNTYVSDATVLAFFTPSDEAPQQFAALPLWDATGATGDTPVRPRGSQPPAEDPIAGRFDWSAGAADRALMWLSDL